MTTTLGPSSCDQKSREYEVWTELISEARTGLIESNGPEQNDRWRAALDVHPRAIR